MVVAIAVYGTLVRRRWSFRDVAGRGRGGWPAVRRWSALVLIVPAHRRRAGSGRVRRLHPERDLRRADRRSAGQARRATATTTSSRTWRRPATGDETVVLGYYGSPEVPGLRLLGDLHRPARSRWSSPTPTTATRWRAATSSNRMPTGSARPESPWCNSCRSATRRVQGVAVIERSAAGARARRDADAGARPAVDRRRGRHAGRAGGRVRRLHPGRYVRRRRATGCACS